MNKVLYNYKTYHLTDGGIDSCELFYPKNRMIWARVLYVTSHNYKFLKTHTIQFSQLLLRQSNIDLGKIDLWYPTLEEAKTSLEKILKDDGWRILPEGIEAYE